METKTITVQQASHLALVQSELGRLDVFARHKDALAHHRIDSRQLAAVEREARIAILDRPDLQNRTKNPRHRPPRIDAPLLRDEIVQTVLFERATNPQKQMKQIVGETSAYYGVSPRYVFRCLKTVAPERRKQMIQSIVVSCFWPEMMLHLQILAGRLLQKST